MKGRSVFERARRSRVALALAAFAGCAAASVAAMAPASAAGPIDWSKAKEHWAFRAPQARRLPAVKQKAWPSQPLDHFILARLEQKRLAPSAEADSRTLIRRVTFDLTGLPPTPEEVEAFVRESAAERPNAQRPTPNAYTRLIDRLLASPAFGERMASMWLPLARYAEDQAHQVGSDTKFFYPNAHLYRQWVVDSFNRDLPYDRFVRWQLAADTYFKETQGNEETQGNGNTVAAAVPPISSISSHFPISSQDLAALGFIGLGPKYYNRNRVEVMADEWQDRVDTVTRTFLGLTVACARCHDHKYDPVTTEDYYALAGVFASTKMVNKSPDGTVDQGSEATKMRKDAMHVIEDSAAQDLNVFVRGSAENKGPVVPRRFLRVLSDEEPSPFRDGSGRKQLAEAIAGPTNPLTARVMVNRVWAVFFGTPLVGTPSNFGFIGDRPTHPELLDDLAVRFEKNGWSVKSLIREIVLSSTYRQASADPTPNAQRPAPNAVDPTNALLWRMNRRRVTVEQWRDAVLSVTGTLERGGGPSMELLDPGNRRRTLYARISRLKLNDLLMQFDYPDANVHAEKRSVTTTPMQKLFMLNSPFMLEQARALAAKLSAGPAASAEERVRRAYLLLYGRAPSADETRLAVGYLQKPEADGMSRWERYAQVLLAANEMLYVD